MVASPRPLAPSRLPWRTEQRVQGVEQARQGPEAFHRVLTGAKDAVGFACHLSRRAGQLLRVTAVIQPAAGPRGRTRRCGRRCGRRTVRFTRPRVETGIETLSPKVICRLPGGSLSLRGGDPRVVLLQRLATARNLIWRRIIEPRRNGVALARIDRRSVIAHAVQAEEAADGGGVTRSDQ